MKKLESLIKNNPERAGVVLALAVLFLVSPIVTTIGLSLAYLWIKYEE